MQGCYTVMVLITNFLCSYAMKFSGLGQIWLDLFRKEPDRIGSGSDLDPNRNLWIWIGSRSKFPSLDRIGSNSKKIGAEYITASYCTAPFVKSILAAATLPKQLLRFSACLTRIFNLGDKEILCIQMKK